MDQLAKIENYNVTYYCDWFKQQTGLSPSFYLRNTRIQRAKELLVTTNFSVMEIAGYGRIQQQFDLYARLSQRHGHDAEGIPRVPVL